MLARAELRKVPRFCRGIVYSGEACGLLPSGVSIWIHNSGSFWYKLTEDIKAPQSARSRAQVGTRRGKRNIFSLWGRCAEIRRQRLIRSGMSSDFSKHTAVTIAPISQTSYPVSTKATKIRAYITAAKLISQSIHHTMADEPPPPLTPSTPATRTAKPVSEALLNDKVLVVPFLLHPIDELASFC